MSGGSAATVGLDPCPAPLPGDPIELHAGQIGWLLAVGASIHPTIISARPLMQALEGLACVHGRGTHPTDERSPGEGDKKNI